MCTMKRNLKERIIRMRKETVLNNEIEIWDKPFTKKQASNIIKGLNTSHYSAVYEYLVREDGYFGLQTWMDIENHNSGMAQSVALEENKTNHGTHKDYHKLAQLKITEDAKFIINSIQDKNNKDPESKQSFWRIACFKTTNTKHMKTRGYYLYNTNVPESASNYVIVI